MSIAQRRADLKRMKRKARRLYPHDAKARCANHLAVCSCAMCGSPRRFYPNSATMQERRAVLSERDHVGGLNQVSVEQGSGE